jgi:hypothetical protein
MSEKKIQVRMASGKIYGPYSREEVIKYIRKKKLKGDEEVFVLGESSWQKLSADPEFFDVLQEIFLVEMGKGDRTRTSQANKPTAINKAANKELSSMESDFSSMPTAVSDIATKEKNTSEKAKKEKKSPPVKINYKNPLENGNNEKVSRNTEPETPEFLNPQRPTSKQPPIRKAKIALLLIIVVIFLYVLTTKQKIEPQTLSNQSITLKSNTNYFIPLKIQISKIKAGAITIPKSIAVKEMDYLPYELSRSEGNLRCLSSRILLGVLRSVEVRCHTGCAA